MGKMFIPALGTEIVLAKDWKFELYNEYRNSDLAHILGIQWKHNQYYMNKIESVTVVIPAGTIMKIDRIYIRAGQTDFNSVTFRVLAANAKKIDWGRPVKEGGFRFWASLDDVNQIDFND